MGIRQKYIEDAVQECIYQMDPEALHSPVLLTSYCVVMGEQGERVCATLQTPEGNVDVSW
jgi:hypothetical protein